LKRDWSSSERMRGSLGGVSTGFSDVNSSSKLLTSSIDLCQGDKNPTKTSQSTEQVNTPSRAKNKQNKHPFTQINKQVTHDSRHEGRLQSSGQKVLPVNVSEECLFFDVFSVPLAGSQTSLWILSQQLEIKSEIQQLAISHLNNEMTRYKKLRHFLTLRMMAMASSERNRG